MNKYEEALDYLRWIGGDGYYKEQREKSFDVLQELIDKATPMKPSIAHSSNGEAESYCRSCQRRFSTPVSWARISYKHCPECGQALDWSEEK